MRRPRSPTARAIRPERTSTARTCGASSSTRRRSSRPPLRRLGSPPPAGAGTARPVDLYVAPVLGVDLPAVDCNELDVRIPLAAFLRPFNVLGWAGLAIGD